MFLMCRSIIVFLCTNIKPLPRQRELDAEAEVLGGCRITARSQQWGVGLAVEIEAHGHQFGEGILSRERQLEGGVAAGCRRRHCGYVAGYRRLLAIAHVESEVETVISASLRTT